MHFNIYIILYLPIIKVYVCPVKVRSFTESLSKYKTLDNVEISQFCECHTFEKIVSSEQMNLNDQITDFNEIDRNQLEFIMEFIQSINGSLYLKYYLNQELSPFYSYSSNKVNILLAL